MNTIESRADRERHNSTQRINRLPIELLSRIFVAGDDLNYASGLPEICFINDEGFDVTAYDFQEIAVQICRHWRAVGLGMPKLWSHISIGQKTPDPRAELFLARSGLTTPLDLSLAMSGSFMEGLEDCDSHSYAKRALECLNFIVKRGGDTSRWRSLKVWCGLPSVMLEVIDFIAGAPLDNLVTLEMDDDPDDSDSMSDFIAAALIGRNQANNVMFHTPPPKLRNLQLGGMPTKFFFQDPPIPLVSNLTQLELGVSCTLPPLQGLYELISLNSGLETLILDMSLVDQIPLYTNRGSNLPINLPHLRHFALKEPKSAAWAIGVLAMINAPEVERFLLNLNHTMPPLSPGGVALFASVGRIGGQMSSTFPLTETDMEHSGPIFPVLQHLTLGPFPDRGTVLGAMIRCFPTLTRLDWELEESCEQAILDLSVHPLPCPRLSHLRVHGVPSDELLEVVQLRALGGMPLKVVEVNSRDWDMINDEAKDYLETALEKFEQYIDENESDSDGEDGDWTDTDGDDSDGSTLDSSESEASG